MLFADKLHDIITTLERDEVLLAPVEFAWAIIFRVTEENLSKIPLRYTSYADRLIYLMMKDLQGIKDIVPNLHPRIETLLHYHRRPLGVRVDIAHLGYRPSIPVACCMAFDPYIKLIVDLLANPLACIYITNGNDRLVANYDEIPTYISKSVGYIAKHRRMEVLAGVKPIVISYDEDGLLELD